MEEEVYNHKYSTHICQGTFLSAAVVIAVIFLGTKFKFRKASPPRRLPPGSLGLPLIGESVSFLQAQKRSSCEEWIESRVERDGPVFKTSLMGKPTIVITGYLGNRFIFTTDDRIIGSNQPATTKAIMGKFSTFELSGNDHKLIRSAMSSFLKPECLKKFIPEIESQIKQQIFQEFETTQVVKVVPLIKRLIFDMACSLLFKIPTGKEADSLFEDFQTAKKGRRSLRLNFPGTTFHRALAARRRIHKYLLSLIEQGTKKMEQGNYNNANDVISIFLNFKDKEGVGLSEEMMIDNIMTLMFGSHDTSAVLLVYLIRHLARDQAIYKCVLEEQMRVLDGKRERELSWDDLQKMKYTWTVAQEMLRIHPPVAGNFRRAIIDTSFGGFDIPKGWQIFWVANGTHMDKNIFPEPKKFDPSRFGSSSKPYYPPYSYIPFGAGAHHCPGNEFARIVVLLVIHHMVTNYEWSATIPNESMIRDPMPYPSQGLPIKIVYRGKT